MTAMIDMHAHWRPAEVADALRARTREPRIVRNPDGVEVMKSSLDALRESLAELQVRKRIREDVQEGAEKQQREYFLRKQMDSIRKELGEDDSDVIGEYRTKIEEAGMPDDVREQAERELGRLERMGESSGESLEVAAAREVRHHRMGSGPWAARADLAG